MNSGLLRHYKMGFIQTRIYVNFLCADQHVFPIPVLVAGIAPASLQESFLKFQNNSRDTPSCEAYNSGIINNLNILHIPVKR